MEDDYNEKEKKIFTFHYVLFPTNHFKHNGPYSWKRNEYSPGISLTAQMWFICLLFSKFILPAQNDEWS